MHNAKTERAHLEQLKGKLLTKQEACEFLGVGKRTLERYCTNGQIEAEHIGHYALFKRADLKRLKGELETNNHFKRRKFADFKEGEEG